MYTFCRTVRTVVVGSTDARPATNPKSKHKPQAKLTGVVDQPRLVGDRHVQLKLPEAAAAAPDLDEVNPPGEVRPLHDPFAAGLYALPVDEHGARGVEDDRDLPREGEGREQGEQHSDSVGDEVPGRRGLRRGHSTRF